MKNQQIVLVIVLLVTGMFATLYFVNRYNKNATQMPIITSTPISTSSGKVETVSRYEIFSPELLADKASKRRVLFFYANWCPTCIPADADFATNKDQLPEDVVVIRVNYNDNDTDESEKELAEKYAITYQHSFVQIDEQGNQITVWNGGKLEELLAKIK